MNEEELIALSAIRQMLNLNQSTVEKCLESVQTVNQVSLNTTEAIWSLMQMTIAMKQKLQRVLTELEDSSGDDLPF